MSLETESVLDERVSVNTFDWITSKAKLQLRSIQTVIAKNIVIYHTNTQNRLFV